MASSASRSPPKSYDTTETSSPPTAARPSHAWPCRPSQTADLSSASRQRILRTALGNPLALVELPAALRAVPGRQLNALPLTARLERAFAARIADLPPLNRDAVLIAAVDDSDELAEILAGAAQLSGQPVGVEVLQHAAAAGLIQIDDLHVHFRHPLVRSGVLQLETVTPA